MLSAMAAASLRNAPPAISCAGRLRPGVDQAPRFAAVAAAGMTARQTVGSWPMGVATMMRGALKGVAN